MSLFGKNCGLLLCRLSRTPRRRLRIVFLASACWAIGAFAQDPNVLLKSLLPYQPEKKITGTIRIWGNKHMQGIVKHWEDGFSKYHPDVRFETNLRGTASAIGGLYTGAADIALTGRDTWPVDIDGFEETFQYKPSLSTRTILCHISPLRSWMPFSAVTLGAVPRQSAPGATWASKVNGPTSRFTPMASAPPTGNSHGFSKTP